MSNQRPLYILLPNFCATSLMYLNDDDDDDDDMIYQHAKVCYTVQLITERR